MPVNEVEIELPDSPTAPAIARRALDGLALSEPPANDACLLTSELVSNAVLHTRPADRDGIHLRVVQEPSNLRVEVSDNGGGFDWDGPQTDASVPGGLGLVLVEAIAKRWGIHTNGRTCVWFDLDIHEETAP